MTSRVLPAHRQVARAIRTGLLVRPGECSQCGVACKPDGAHTDYNAPLDVIWLCRPCHTRFDAKPRPIDLTDWGEVQRRLTEIERDWSWLARRIGISKQRLSNYKLGLHATPERVRRDIEMVLGIRDRNGNPPSGVAA